MRFAVNQLFFVMGYMDKTAQEEADFDPGELFDRYSKAVKFDRDAAVQHFMRAHEPLGFKHRKVKSVADLRRKFPKVYNSIVGYYQKHPQSLGMIHRLMSTTKKRPRGVKGIVPGLVWKKFQPQSRDIGVMFAKQYPDILRQVIARRQQARAQAQAQAQK